MSRNVRVVVDGLQAGEQTLDATASRHLVRVHRLKAGQHFVAVDPTPGLQARGEVLFAHVRSARVVFDAPQAMRPPELPAITLVQALGKGDKADQIVRAATTLGVSRLLFVLSERSVPRPDSQTRRKTRWRTIAQQAARQCVRPGVPQIEGPIPFAQGLHRVSEPLRLALDPTAQQVLLAEVQRHTPLSASAVLIGPEGGLTDAELEAAGHHGFSRVRFGPFVLRTETAAVAVLGALLAVSEGRPEP